MPVLVVLVPVPLARAGSGYPGWCRLPELIPLGCAGKKPGNVSSGPRSSGGAVTGKVWQIPSGFGKSSSGFRDVAGTNRNSCRKPGPTEVWPCRKARQRREKTGKEGPPPPERENSTRLCPVYAVRQVPAADLKGLQEVL